LVTVVVLVVTVLLLTLLFLISPKLVSDNTELVSEAELVLAEVAVSATGAGAEQPEKLPTITVDVTKVTPVLNAFLMNIPIFIVHLLVIASTLRSPLIKPTSFYNQRALNVH
jgi:hypothetical protein